MDRALWTKSVWGFFRGNAGTRFALEQAYDRGAEWSIQPIVALKADAYEDPHKFITHVSCQLIAFLGWDKETSLQMYKNFRFVYPQLKLNPEAHRLMTLAALKEEYGMFGLMLSEAAHRPGCQPYLELLLGGAVDLVAARRVVALNLVVEIDSMVPSATPPSRRYVFSGAKEGEALNRSIPVYQGDVLSYAEAAAVIKRVSGEDHNFMADLDPFRDDYEELAKAGIDIRTAQGP